MASTPPKQQHKQTVKQTVEAEIRSLVAETRGGGALSAIGLGGGASSEHVAELKSAAEAAIRKLRSLPEGCIGGGTELLRPFLFAAQANYRGSSKIRAQALAGVLKLGEIDALDEEGVGAVLDTLGALVATSDATIRVRMQQVLLAVAQGSAHPKEPARVHQLVSLCVQASAASTNSSSGATSSTGAFTLLQVLTRVFDHAAADHQNDETAAATTTTTSPPSPQQQQQLSSRSVAAVEVLSYLCDSCAGSSSSPLPRTVAFDIIAEACIRRQTALIEHVAPYRVVVRDSLIPVLHAALLESATTDSSSSSISGSAMACAGLTIANLYDSFPTECGRLLKELTRIASAGARCSAPSSAFLASLGALRVAMRGPDRRRRRGSRLLLLAAQSPPPAEGLAKPETSITTKSPSLLRCVVTSVAGSVRAATGPPNAQPTARAAAALEAASRYFSAKAKGSDWGSVAVDAWKLASDGDDVGGDSGTDSAGNVDTSSVHELSPRVAGAACALSIDTLNAIADGIEAACEPSGEDDQKEDTSKCSDAVSESWRGTLRAAEDLLQHRSVTETLALESLAVVQSLACASGALGLLEPRDASLHALCRAAKRPCFAAVESEDAGEQPRSQRSESMSMLSYGTSMTSSLVATIATTAVSTPARAVRAARELTRSDSGHTSLGDRNASEGSFNAPLQSSSSATSASVIEASAPLEAINRHALRSLLNASHRLDAVLGRAWDPVVRTLADVEVRLKASYSDAAFEKSASANERETLSMALSQLFASSAAMPDVACASLARALARLSEPIVSKDKPAVEDQMLAVEDVGWVAPTSARRAFAARRLNDMAAAQSSASRRELILRSAAPLILRAAVADTDALTLASELLPILAGLVIEASSKHDDDEDAAVHSSRPIEVLALEPLYAMFEGAEIYGDGAGDTSSPRQQQAPLPLSPRQAGVATGRQQRPGHLMPPPAPVLVPTERDRLRAALVAVTSVLHAHGHQLGEGWDVAAKLLGRVASLASGSSSTGEDGADGSGDVVHTAAPLVSACLEPLQLMLNEHVAKLPLRCVRSAVWCASQCCAQTADLNASLAAAAALWSACDHYGKEIALAAQRNESSQGDDEGKDAAESTAQLLESWEAASVDVSALGEAVLPTTAAAEIPLTILAPTLALASLIDVLAIAGRDTRPEVRNASSRSLCAVLSHDRYAQYLPAALTHQAVNAVVLPLLGHARKRCAEATRDTRLQGATLGRDANTGKEMRMLVHHSRNSEGKQWDETLATLLGGACKVVRRHAGLAARRQFLAGEEAEESSRRPQFARSAYQTACGICEWCLLEGNKEVAEAAAGALASLLAPYAPPQNGQDGGDVASSALSPLVGRALHSFEAAICGPAAQGTAALATPVSDSVALKLLKELRNLCRGARDRVAFLNALSRNDMACICRFVKHAMTRHVMDVAGVDAEQMNGASSSTSVTSTMSTPASRRSVSNEATEALASFVPLPPSAHALWLEMLHVPLELLWSTLHGELAETTMKATKSEEGAKTTSLSPVLLSYMSRVYRSACALYADDDVPGDVHVAAVGAISSIACDLWRAIASTAVNGMTGAQDGGKSDDGAANPAALSRAWSRVAQGWSQCVPVIVRSAGTAATGEENAIVSEMAGEFSPEASWSCIADAFRAAMEARVRVDDFLLASPRPSGIASDDDALTTDAETPLLDTLASTILAACSPGSTASGRVRASLVGSLETRALGAGGAAGASDAADVATRKLFALASSDWEEEEMAEDGRHTRIPSARRMALVALLRHARTACRWVCNAPKPRARWLTECAARVLEALTQLDVFSADDAVYAANHLAEEEGRSPASARLVELLASAADGSRDEAEMFRGCIGGIILHPHLVELLRAVGGGGAAVDARAAEHASALLHAAGNALGLGSSTP